MRRIAAPPEPDLTDRERFHAERDVEQGIFATIAEAEAFRFELRDKPELYPSYILARCNGCPDTLARPS